MSFLSTAVQQVLDEGPFCAVATATPRGPHCTPLVFAASGGKWKAFWTLQKLGREGRKELAKRQASGA